MGKDISESLASAGSLEWRGRELHERTRGQIVQEGGKDLGFEMSNMSERKDAVGARVLPDTHNHFVNENAQGPPVDRRSVASAIDHLRGNIF